MKQRKFLKLISIVLLAMFTFVSCSKEAKEISQALFKTAEIKSYTFDSSVKMHLDLPMGLMGVSNEFPIDVEVTSNGLYKLNKDNLPTSLANININVMDLKVDTELYLEPTSKEGKSDLNYYFKMPQFLKVAAGLGQEKGDYLKYNLNDLLKETNTLPMDTGIYEQLLTNREALIQVNNELLDILKPLSDEDIFKNLIVSKGHQKIKQREGNIFAKTYEIKITNENLKPILKSILSNDEVIKNFLEFSNKYSVEENKIDTDMILAELDANRSEILSQIDLIPNILGENGLTFRFSIKNGYIVYQQYVMDINFQDVFKVQVEGEIYYYDINKPLTITRPSVDDNSINAIELMNKYDIIPSKKEEPTSTHYDKIKFLKTNGKSINGTAAEYFFPQEKAIYHYTDVDGNEVNSIELQYFQNDNLQARYITPYYDFVMVYSINDKAITPIFTGEYVEGTDFTKTEERIPGNIIISAPLSEGNSWENADGSVTYISSTSTEVSTPSGTYDSIELTTFYGGEFTVRNYYAKGVGLVKTITTADFGNGVQDIATDLSSIEK